MDNYITKRAQLSLQIRIVKSTSFMISTKDQAILVTQKHEIYKIYKICDVADYIQKCDHCQRQSSLPPNVKNEINSVTVLPHVKKQVSLDLCSLSEVDSYQLCNDYFTKWSEINPVREKNALTVATFLYEFMCRHGCFEVEINDQGRVGVTIKGVTLVNINWLLL